MHFERRRLQEWVDSILGIGRKRGVRKDVMEFLQQEENRRGVAVYDFASIQFAPPPSSPIPVDVRT